MKKFLIAALCCYIITPNVLALSRGFKAPRSGTYEPSCHEEKGNNKISEGG